MTSERSVSARLTAIVGLIAFGTVLLIVVGSIVAQYVVASRRIEAERQRIDDTIIPVLSHLVWTVNVPQTLQLLDSIRSTPLVASVSLHADGIPIIAPHGTVTTNAPEASPEHVVSQRPEAGAPEPIVWTLTYNRGDEIVQTGRLQLEFVSPWRVAATNNTLFILLIIGLLGVSAILGTLAVAVRHEILAPLQRVEREIAAIDPTVGMCPDGFRDEPLDYTEVRSIRRTLGDSWRRVTSEIAVRREAEQSLAALVEEKQMLLQEIHHRVKNNLQVVVSLLALEERRISSPEAHAALLDSRNRIMSMAYVHELLYRGESTTHVRLNEYLADLIGGIDGTTNHEARISFDIEAHPACVRLDTAIPTGLIVTELVTNALKHAYQPGESGAISVRAYPVDDGDADRARLVVADAGSGMDAAVFEQRTGATSLGLEIVRSLCSQLRTELVREPSEQGTVLSFTIDTMNDC